VRKNNARIKPEEGGRKKMPPRKMLKRLTRDPKQNVVAGGTQDREKLLYPEKLQKKDQKRPCIRSGALARRVGGE